MNEEARLTERVAALLERQVALLSQLGVCLQRHVRAVECAQLSPEIEQCAAMEAEITETITGIDRAVRSLRAKVPAERVHQLERYDSAVAAQLAAVQALHRQATAASVVRRDTIAHLRRNAAVPRRGRSVYRARAASGTPLDLTT